VSTGGYNQIHSQFCALLIMVLAVLYFSWLALVLMKVAAAVEAEVGQAVAY